MVPDDAFDPPPRAVRTVRGLVVSVLLGGVIGAVYGGSLVTCGGCARGETPAPPPPPPTTASPFAEGHALELYVGDPCAGGACALPPPPPSRPTGAAPAVAHGDADDCPGGVCAPPPPKPMPAAPKR